MREGDLLKEVDGVKVKGMSLDDIQAPSESRVQGSGSGSRVQGSGSRVQGSGFRVGQGG